MLCSQHKLKAEDVHGKAAEMEAVEEMLSRVMPALTTPTNKYADGGGGGLKGLLQPATLRATRNALAKEYDGAWTPRSQLDGRFFFTDQAPLRRVAPSVPASPMVPRGRKPAMCAHAQTTKKGKLVLAPAPIILQLIDFGLG